MKKVVLLLCSIIITSFSFAQSLTTINYEIKTNLEKAKTDIDKYLLKDPTSAQAWYYKGKVYNALSKNNTSKKDCTDCKMDAFDAFKQYQQLDKKAKLLIDNADLFDIYKSYFNVGSNAYYKKDYNGALYNFKNAALVQDYIKSNNYSFKGFRFPKMDTLLVTNLATTARAAHNDSAALGYYQMLTSANLSDSQFIGDYIYITNHFKQQKNWKSFDSSVAVGEKLFPKSDYWAKAKNDKTESISADAADKALKELITPSYDSVLETNLTTAQSLYYKSKDYGDAAKQVKGWETADFQKRTQLKDSANLAANDAITLADNTATSYETKPELKTRDKANYLQTLGLLQKLYTLKHNGTMASVYAAKIQSGGEHKIITETKAAAKEDKAAVVEQPSVKEATPEVQAEATVTTITTTVSASPDINLTTAQSLYKRSKDYADSVKKAKGWETADFQKRARLKDSSTAAVHRAIPYAEASAKTYEASSNLNDAGKANYIQSLSLLDKLYTADHNTTKAAEYGARLLAVNGVKTTVPVNKQIDENVPAAAEDNTPVATVSSNVTPSSDPNLASATALYQRSKDYADSVKKAKGWETADFQKRARLKDSSTAAIHRAIPLAEATVNNYEATTNHTAADKADYNQALNLLQKLYTADHNATKVAFYASKLANTKDGNTVASVEEEKTTSTPVKAAPVEVVEKPVAHEDVKPLENNASPEANLFTAQTLYLKSQDYNDSIKEAKGWETADFQKRARLKDSVSSITNQAIGYATTASQAYEAMPSLEGNNKSNYTQSLNLLQKLYTAKHDATKAAIYKAKLSGGAVPVASVTPAAIDNSTKSAAAPVVPAPTQTVTLASTPEANLVFAQSFYSRSQDYSDSVKKAKGWETADFQKRARLKDSVSTALNLAIPYGEAAVKGFAAIPKRTQTDKDSYLQALSLMQDIYTAKHNTAKAAEYSVKLKALE